MSIQSPERAAVEFARRLLDKTEKLPPQVFSLAQRHIYDYFGVTIAGFDHPTTRKLYRHLFDDEPQKVPGMIEHIKSKASLRDSIFIKTLASHIYDFDDDEPMLSIAHTTAPVFSAVWAFMEKQEMNGDRAIRAYAMGVETMVQLGALMNPRHYRKGWHSSATLGVFGSAAAIGYLLHYTPEQLALAFQFCATMASGTKTSFGSDAKPLQVAHAASNGLIAVQYARLGLTASAANCFGPGGLLDLYTNDDAAPLASLPTERVEYALEIPGLTIKRYPSCTCTHAAMDEIRHLCRVFIISTSQIDRIDITAGADIPKILIYDVPDSVLEAKFCLKFCVAAAALDGDVTLKTFSDEYLRSPKILELMEKIQVKIVADPLGSGQLDDAVSMTVSYAGKQESCFFRYPSGSPQRPISDEDLDAKFAQCTDGLLDSAQREAVAARLKRVGDIKLNKIFEL